MHKISERLTQVRKSIDSLARSTGRDPTTIQLLAVSKTQPAEAVEAAYATGQAHFGENYLQEALEKMTALRQYSLQWHFIGPVQSNKTRDLAKHFDWVHTVERVKIGERLSRQRPQDLPPLNICVQVNIDGETSKSGCLPEQAGDLCHRLAELPRLRLRGLMTLPRRDNTTAAFVRLAALRDEINTALGLQLDTLSMGMSDDLPEAIAAGATIVRVGTAVFGPRETRQG